MNRCEMCNQAMGCDQVEYDCPLRDFKGKPYQFKDKIGNDFRDCFKSKENAQHFADYAGFIYVGEAK